LPFVLYDGTQDSVDPNKPDLEKRLQCYMDREDYMECLHHRKEHARIQMIGNEDARQKVEAAGGGDGGGPKHMPEHTEPGE